MEEALLELLQKVEASAPHVWEIVMRQVYVGAYVRFGIALIVALVLAAWIYGTVNEWNAMGTEYQTLAIMIGIVLLLITLAIAGWGVAMVVNPEYYAMKMLVDGFAGVLR